VAATMWLIMRGTRPTSEHDSLALIGEHWH
jgi:hypothetical protein